MKECISNLVYEFRIKAGLTQEQLAAVVHVTRQTIIAIEKGHYTPSVHLALLMSAYFKVTVEEIFFIDYE